MTAVFELEQAPTGSLRGECTDRISGARGGAGPLSNSFTRQVLVFSLANLLALVSNGVITFLLPRLLSMETFGYYRLFLLYGGFTGVLHLGLLDGALTRWAAYPQRRIRAELGASLVCLLFSHVGLAIPMIVVLALAFHQQPWFFLVVAVAVYSIVFNVSMLGQFSLQSEKRFGLLSAVIVVNPTLLLVAVLLLYYAHHLTLSAVIACFIISWVLTSIPVWGHLLRKYPSRTKSARHVWRIGKHNIRVGWSVLLAQLLTNVTLSLDRVVVSFAFSIRDFAIYSLAATALAVVNTIILSISRVVFPYLANGSNSEKHVRAYWYGEACLIGLWAVSLIGYFPLQWLIRWLLPNYVPSLPILRFLMLGTGLAAIIHILQANYLRSRLRLGQLLFGSSAGLLAAVILLMLARHTGHLSIMALAMLGALGLWWVLNEQLLKSLTGAATSNLIRTALVYAGCAAWFVLCSSWANVIVGACAYLSVAAILVTVSYWSIFRAVPRLAVSSPLALDTKILD